MAHTGLNHWSFSFFKKDFYVIFPKNYKRKLFNPSKDLYTCRSRLLMCKWILNQFVFCIQNTTDNCVVFQRALTCLVECIGTDEIVSSFSGYVVGSKKVWKKIEKNRTKFNVSSYFFQRENVYQFTNMVTRLGKVLQCNTCVTNVWLHHVQVDVTGSLAQWFAYRGSFIPLLWTFNVSSLEWNTVYALLQTSCQVWGPSKGYLHMKLFVGESQLEA